MLKNPKENTNYYLKYLKYKNKYLQLQNSIGGTNSSYTDLKLKLKDAITNKNIILTEEELRLIELTDNELEKINITREQYEEFKQKCKDLHDIKLKYQIANNFNNEDMNELKYQIANNFNNEDMNELEYQIANNFNNEYMNELNLNCNKIANLENFKLKKFELKNTVNLKSPKLPILPIEGIDNLPGSVFQLLELFYRLPYEITIYINKSINGTIGLFLTKGQFGNTGTNIDALCGINIHTHHYHLPQRKTDMKYWPPSSDDINVSIGNILHKLLRIKTFKLSDIKHDYVFDGYNLWFHKPNIAMINEIKTLNENQEKLNTAEENLKNLQDAINDNTDNNAMLLADLQINLEIYINKMNDLVDMKNKVPDNEVIGIDIGLIPESEFKNKQSVNIPDSLTCTINELIENHIILPPTGLLNNEDLELLYEKALKIFEKQKN
jgi:hypothetical protein